MASLSNIVAIPLAGSWLCTDCATISNQAVQCPACASQHGMLSLSVVLNRKPLSDIPLIDYGRLSLAVGALESALRE